MNSFHFSPGDRILFKRGGVWRETLSIPSNGSEASPIIFAVYGSGAKPIISASDLKSNPADWTDQGSNVWKTYSPMASVPYQVFFDGKKGVNVPSIAEVNGPGKWHNDSSRYIYVYSAGNPADAYRSPGIEISQRDRVISVWQKEHVTIRNLDARHSSSNSNGAINLASSHYIKIERCQASGAFGPGILASGSNIAITGNTIHDAAGTAILIWNDNAINKDNIIIANNNVYYSKTGILVYSNTPQKNISIRSNRIFNLTGGSGISVSGYSEVDVHRNTIFNVTNLGIFVHTGDLHTISDVDVYSNTINGACKITGACAGIQIGGTRNEKKTLDARVHDNIVKNVRFPDKNDGMGIDLDIASDGAKAYRNYVYNCSGGGLATFGCDGCEFFYNIVEHCGHDAGPGINPTAPRAGLRVSSWMLEAKNNKFYNNIVYDCYNGIYLIGGTTGTALEPPSGNIFKNNIIYNSKIHHVFFRGDSNILDNNVYYPDANPESNKFNYLGTLALDFADWKAKSGQDSGSLLAEPLFADAANHRFNLKADSPAIEKGAEVGLDQDYYGTAVPQFVNPDIGAFEYFQGLLPTDFSDPGLISPKACIEIPETISYIDGWKADSQDVTITELIETLSLWKKGC